MAESFDSFNAPQFFDFSQDLHKDENVDSYFEVDHENIKQEVLEDPLKFRNSEEVKHEDEKDKSEYYSPLKATPYNYNDYEEDSDDKPRRSMSVGNLILLCETEYKEVKTTSKLKTSEKKNRTLKYSSSNNLKRGDSSTSLNNDKASSSRTSVPRLTRYASKENLDRLAQPKKYSSAHNLNQDNYVSMAEAVRKFQSGTPVRFRSRPKLMSSMNKLGATIPQSPALITKNRHRPVNAISREQQEMIEYAEAQKFKIKAHPLNKKILQGPLKPTVPVEKKPSTIVEPFNITAPKKLQVTEIPKTEAIEFHAKPIPKGLYEPRKLKPVQKTMATVPQTPSFMKRCKRDPVKPQLNQEEPKPTVKLGKTTPMPFSFEQRDQVLLKKREQLIKKVMEEEKKAREFHARPAPRAIRKLMRSNSVDQDSGMSSIYNSSHTKSEENLLTQFKARPPTVLYKKPFEPKKDERHLIEITAFELNTEKRAKEREEFEQNKKEKEEKIALAKQLEEQLQLQKEEEEVARLRKEAEYKAKPVKKYKEIVIQPSGKVTEPVSPKFHTVKLRNKENKENSN